MEHSGSLDEHSTREETLDIHNSIKYRLKIPMMTDKRSLNIASSVAIILSENLRQTNFNK